MRRSDSGQIVPLTAVLIAGVILFAGANAYRMHLCTDKIRRQRLTDETALLAANQQARALNAIAALNEALAVLVRNGRIYQLAMVAANSCAVFSLAAWFAAPVCVRAAVSLNKDAPAFFRKVRKAGETFARWQDEIAAWAEKAPEEIVEINNLLDNGNGWSVLHPLRPGHPAASLSTRLRLRRSSAEGFSDLGADPGDVDFAAGGDLTECKAREYPPEAFEAVSAEGESLHPGSRRTVKYHYAAGDNPSLRVERDDFPGPTFHDSDGRFWQAEKVVVRRCVGFKDLLKDLGISLSITVPPPYVLEESFATEQRITVTRAENPQLRLGLSGSLRAQSSGFDTLISVGDPGDKGIGFGGALMRVATADTLWTIAEARIEGTSLSTMGFRASLAKLRHYESVWSGLSERFPTLLRPFLDTRPLEVEVGNSDFAH